MKKVILLAGVACFVFASCCSKGDKCPNKDATDTTCKEVEKPCCKEMTEEQKQAIADWKSWSNIDEARKNVLLQERKDRFEQCKVEREKRQTELEALEAKMADWENLSIDEKRALIDEIDQFFKARKKHHGDKKDCCSHDKK